MTICEEDFTSAKPFRQQFLFHRFRLEKALPRSVHENAMLALLCETHLRALSLLISSLSSVSGNLGDRIHTEEDLSQLLHVDPTWQYKDGINVPYQKKLVTLFHPRAVSPHRFSSISLHRKRNTSLLRVLKKKREDWRLMRT
jgi:hypothetical protein